MTGFMEHDHMIEALAPNRTKPAPRRLSAMGIAAWTVITRQRSFCNGL